MKKLILTTVFSVMFCLNSANLLAQTNSQIDWLDDFQEAQKTAAQENKLVLLHFSATWCRPCQNLKRFVFINKRVQRAIESNCIPVEVDVDEHTDLVQEFGVASVPFDIAITPGGRIITKRSSPLNSSAYAEMIEGLDRAISSLAKGDNPALNQNLDELKQKLKTNQKLVKNPTLVPVGPSHSAPAPSHESGTLKRKSKIINPYALAAQQQVTPRTASTDLSVGKAKSNESSPKQIINQYAAHAATLPPTKKIVPEVQDFVPFQSAQPKLEKPVEMLVENSSINQSFRPAVQPDAPLEIQPKAQIENSTDFEPFHENLLAVDAMEKPALPSASPPAELMAAETSVATIQPMEQQTVKAEAHAKILDKPGIDNQSESSDFVPQAEAVAKVVQFQPEPHPESVFSSESAAASDSEFVGQVAGFIKQKAPDTNPTLTEFALRGKCPVTLLSEGRWVDGDSQFGCVHRKRVYRFTSEKNLKMFQQDPDAFSPLLAGFDPVVYSTTGELVDGKEEHGVFMGVAPNQRVVLFENAETRAEFESNPHAYIGTIRQAMRSSGGQSSPIQLR